MKTYVASDSSGDWTVEASSLEEALRVAAGDVAVGVKGGDYGRRAQCEGTTLEVRVSIETETGHAGAWVLVEVEGNGEAYDPESDD